MSEISSRIPLNVGARYILHEPIGQGGMGIVYRATDRLTGEEIALKQVLAGAEDLLFHSRVPGTPNVQVALAHEFQTLATLRHPNVVSVFDYGFDASHYPYFTMELLEGGQPITQQGFKLSLDAQLELLAQLLQALIYLHRRSIIHSDLKPSNVLVTKGVVKVL